MKKYLLAILVMLYSLNGIAINEWKMYMAYNLITDIEPAGNLVYVLASKGLFSYNVNDHSVTAYSKQNGLNDTEISYIAWCEQAKRLVIVYSNYNIDLLDKDGTVTNLSDYYNKIMVYSKNMKGLNVAGTSAFLCTDFGVVKIDVKNKVISDTYILNNVINDCMVIGNKIYATCANKSTVYSANLTDNLLDYNNWTAQHNVNINYLYNINGQLIGLNNRYIVKLNNNDSNWSAIYQNDNVMTPFYNSSQLLMIDGTNLIIFNNDLSVQKKAIENIKAIAYDSTNKCYWSNQDNDKLQSFTLDSELQPTITTTGIATNSPKYNYFFHMQYVNNTLYTTGGAYTNLTTYFRNGCVQTLKDGQWTVYQDDMQKTTKIKYQDVNCLAVDPNNPEHVFVGATSGLYEFESGQFKNFWNSKNSILTSMLEGSNGWEQWTLIDALFYDEKGSLWVFNSRNEVMIIEIKPNGEWIDHTPADFSNVYSRFARNCTPFIHTDGNIWFASESWSLPALVRFNPNDNSYKLYNNFTNQDGTTVKANIVRCAVPDKEGNIWIGTMGGPLMLSASEIANGGTQFTQVKVPRNDGSNLADYLLSDINITCMAIDGAGRKWFGTYGNGVYLISADNMEEIYHFTETNSQLLSNVVESIAINNDTGEVFFGTLLGLCSFMSDAKESYDELIKDNVYAYPNPVRPDYNGVITVTGLTFDADVKIVSSNGTLVNQGRSNGGYYTWNGNDLTGKRVASGIYMVVTATSDGKKGVVCKIAIVN